MMLSWILIFERLRVSISHRGILSRKCYSVLEKQNEQRYDTLNANACCWRVRDLPLTDIFLIYLVIRLQTLECPSLLMAIQCWRHSVVRRITSHLKYSLLPVHPRIPSQSTAGVLGWYCLFGELDSHVYIFLKLHSIQWMQVVSILWDELLHVQMIDEYHLNKEHKEIASWFVGLLM